MKKQLIISSLCLVLLMVMLLSSTLAWFTDSKSNVNTMVAGKISITQTVVDTQAVVMPTVVIDRTITVTNDGNQPAYVRTLIAFEDKAFTVDGATKTMVEYLDLGDSNIAFAVDSEGKKVQFTAADGTLYTVGYYLHDGELAAGHNYNCLNSITLNMTAPSQWQVAAGEQYQILALSQAVQTVGLEGNAATALDTVFGDIATNAADWFTNVLAAN